MSFKNISGIVAAVLSVCVSSAAANNIANSATVYLVSDPGSYVGGGIGAPSVTWVHGLDGVFYGGPSYGSFDRGVRVGYNDGNYWNFEFAAPTYDPATNTNDGQPLKVGLYTGAQRFPFNSPTKPGISISGNGRGNNTQTGWFNVLEIAYDDAGTLNKFAVDFKQFDESNETIGLYGSLRFNSSIAITAVPEPDALALLGVGGLALAAAWLPRRRRQLGSQLADVSR